LRGTVFMLHQSFLSGETMERSHPILSLIALLGRPLLPPLYTPQSAEMEANS
jgi:hypothetical protein